MKLTINEIVQALRCHADCQKTCDPCVFVELMETDENCTTVLCTAAADLIEEYVDRCARFSEEIMVLREQRRWIPVEERLPEVETEVLVQYNRNGYKSITTAMYEDGTVFSAESEWNWTDIDGEYDEERDDIRVPQGWWEYRHFNPDDVYNNMIDVPVTHWMPLPPAPEEEVNNGKDG